MKSLNEYIVEKLKVNKNTKSMPDSVDDLFDMVEEAIKNDGPKCNLNYIDVSKITDFSRLFENTEFNGDVSEWDVSSATNMRNMFSHCPFDGDLSKWNVSNVENMARMFWKSGFTGDKGDIGKWDISKLDNMNHMFEDSQFNGDLSNWNIDHVSKANKYFLNCPAENDYTKTPDVTL